MKKIFSLIFDNKSLMGFVFILPAFLGTIVFILIPVLCSFGLSFVEWDLINSPKLVWFDNYIELFQSPLFFKILLNTFVYAISTSILAVIIPLVLACVLNSKIRGSNFFKVSFFLPFVTPMIVIAFIWQWIFDPNIGIMNYVFHLNINWLYDSKFAMPAVIIVSVWKLIGYNMIIFLAGLSSINQSLFEAAKIDGASKFDTFKFVTVPLLSPTIFFVVIITCISSFQVFDLIYMMTQGGPLDSTNVLVYAVYQNAFEFFKVGYASAVAYVLFFIIFFLTMFQWKYRKKMVYLEE
ncbi:MAG: sugar ABC transporter permease [bacterium]|nr:sugar ABC transporter permease [bacterium]